MSAWPDRARALRTPFAAVAAAVLVLDLLAWAFGHDPAGTLAVAIAGSWGTAYGVGQVLFKATPLLFAGTAVDLALRAGLFNIGVDGQIAMASLVATVVAIHVPAGLPAPLAVALVLVVAMAAGGGWAAVAGGMRTRFGAHEVITTIMLNRVADAVVALAMGSWLALAGTTRTADIAACARIPRLEVLSRSLGGSAASFALLGAVASVVVVWLALRRTRVGRETVWVGLNDRACEAEGVPVRGRRLLAMAASGAIAGLAVSGTVLGYKGYFEIGLGAGAGFGGIAVAFLGRGHPVGLVLAALLFGTLEQAGLAINARVPKDAMGMLEAVVIVVVALADRAARREASEARLAPAERGAP
jgi:simple sugar transport system permease protein